MGNNYGYSGGGDGSGGRGRRISEGTYYGIVEESKEISSSLHLCIKTTDSLGGTSVGEVLSARVFIKGSCSLEEHEDGERCDGLDDGSVGCNNNHAQSMYLSNIIR